MSELLLNSAKEMVDKIYRNMSKVETCEAIKEEIKDIPFVFIRGDNMIRLDGVLTDDQVDSVRKSVMLHIDQNKKSAEDFLSSITGAVPEKKKPAIINQDFEDAVNEMVAEGKKKKVVKKVSANKPEPKKVDKKITPVVLDVEMVRKLYLKEDRTIIEVADILGTNKSTLYRFINDNGLRKPKKKDEVFRDAKTPSKRG